MDHPLIVAILAILVFNALRFGMALILARGDIKRIGLAMRCGFSVLRDAAFAARVQPLLEPAPVEEKKPPRLSGVPLRVLTLLQREGRLLDFLQENIKAYSDDQIGSAVREIHSKCQAALKEHLTLEPVLAQDEGETVEVAAGFDPSAIRLTGNVTGSPPFRGTLQHRGWRVKDYKLPAPPEGQDDLVLMPAEVELP